MSGPRAPVAVVHVTPSYPPALGGLEKVAEALAAERAARRLPVQVLTARERSVATPAYEDPAYVHRLAAVHVAHTAVIPQLPLRLLRLRRSLIHLHVAQAYTPESVWLASRLRDLPYLAHVHLDVGPSGPAGALLHLYKPLVLKRVLQRAARVVVFTDEQRDDIVEKYGLQRWRVAVIPNGVDARFFHPPRHLPDRSRFRLLFVGRLSVQKNVPLLLDALEGISDRFETVLVGEGELEGALRAQTKRLKLHNVTFVGRADGAALRRHYESADLFVLPSEREGMPLVLLEALAMALPIVATDVTGSRDVLLDGDVGKLVPLADPARLREALLEVVGNETDYHRLSTASRRHATTFSWEEVAQHFESLYRQIADEHDARSAL
jgi:glycosyltransferase involved in cell wall biosynthesis